MDTSLELKMGEAVGRHIARMASGDRLCSATVYPNKRDKNGWLEWLLVYEFEGGSKLTVGAIQRHTQEDEVEFHS